MKTQLWTAGHDKEGMSSTSFRNMGRNIGMSPRGALPQTSYPRANPGNWGPFNLRRLLPNRTIKTHFSARKRVGFRGRRQAGMCETKPRSDLNESDERRGACSAFVKKRAEVAPSAAASREHAKVKSQDL